MNKVENSLDTKVKQEDSAAGSLVAPLRHTATTSVKTSSATTPSILRTKTRGEKLFDFATYIGVGIALNEMIALGFYWLFEKHPGPLKRGYEWAEKASAKLPVLGKVEYIGSGRFLAAVTALLGGTVALLPTKWMEDAKSNMVRFFDRHLYNNDTKNESSITKLQEEMDKVPKQSWRSLWNGRMVVMPTAVTIDYLLCQPNSIVAKRFEGTRFQDYASVDRMGATLARKAMDWLNPAGKEVRALGRTLNPPDKPYNVRHEGAGVFWTQKAFYLLTVAVTTTALFYISSKLFAKSIAKKADRKEAITNGEIPAKEATTDEQRTVAPNTSLPEVKPTPKNQVSDVAHSEQRVQTGAAHIAKHA